MNILFVCKNNRFRSRIAEAYFKKINKNRKINVKSAGIFKGKPVSKLENNITKKFGISIIGRTNGLSDKLLRWQDIIIIVASDVPRQIFKDKVEVKKVISWNIKDTTEKKGIKIEEVAIAVIKKINQLNKQLKK